MKRAGWIALFCLLVGHSGVAVARDWSDASGRYRLEGNFVELAGDVVVIKSHQGQHYKIRLHQLSQADRQFVEEYTTALAEVEAHGGAAALKLTPVSLEAQQPDAAADPQPQQPPAPLQKFVYSGAHSNFPILFVAPGQIAGTADYYHTKTRFVTRLGRLADIGPANFPYYQFLDLDGHPEARWAISVNPWHGCYVVYYQPPRGVFQFYEFVHRSPRS